MRHHYNKIIEFIFLIIIPIYLLYGGQSNNSNKIIELGNYKGLPYEKIEVNVTDEEVEETVDNELKSDATLIKIDDRNIVSNGDFIFITYKSYVNNEIKNDVTGDLLKVGTGYYSIDLENQLIGKEVNKEYTIDLILENDFSKEIKAGESVTFDIIITSINYYDIPAMDDYVLQLGYASVDEYYEKRRNDLIYDRTFFAKEKQADEILKQISKESKFILSNTDIETNYNNILNSYKDLPDLYDMTFEDYLKNILNLTKREFYKKCKDEAKYMIQRDLIIQEIIKRENLDIKDEELDEIAAVKYHINKDTLYQNRPGVKELILRDMAYDILFE